MSFWLIFAIIFAILTTICVATGLVVADDEAKPVALGAAIITGVITIALVFIASFTIVPTRSVGVVTAFGKPTGSLRNGGHMVRPWAEVEKFDASVQTLKLDGNSKDDTSPCVTVRLGNQTTACVDVSVQWNIDPTGDVIELYRRYKSFGNIEDNLIKRQLQHALNIAFETYDPLRNINVSADKQNQTLDQIAGSAKTVLAAGVGNGITVLSLTIPIVHFDGDTEGRLKAYQQALADTRIAEQKRQTAEQTKAANDILAGSNAAKDLGVQYQNCLDLIRDLGNKGQLQSLPVGALNCGGSSQTPVIVGSK